MITQFVWFYAPRCYNSLTPSLFICLFVLLTVASHIPYLFHLVTLLVSTGPPTIRASIHGLVINIIQSLCTCSCIKFSGEYIIRYSGEIPSIWFHDCLDQFDAKICSNVCAQLLFAHNLVLTKRKCFSDFFSAISLITAQFRRSISFLCTILSW